MSTNGTAAPYPSIPTSMTEVEHAIKQIPWLEQFGKELAGSLHGAVLNGGSLTRAAADLLHGTWLGHPLHAVLTDIPLGAWVMAAIFDSYAMIEGDHTAERAADALVALGVATAVPTALSGLADYSAIDEDAISVGAAHAILNSAGLGLYLLSLWSRSQGRRGWGVGLSMAALGLIGSSAGLGGHLVYGMRVGVNHAPAPEKTPAWRVALLADELPEAKPQRVEVDGVPVLLYRKGDTIYALNAVCNHAGGPLEEGTFADGCVECPWHQSVFALDDGHVVHGPATLSQPAYEARLRRGNVEVRLRRKSSSQSASHKLSEPARKDDNSKNE